MDRVDISSEVIAICKKAGVNHKDVFEMIIEPGTATFHRYEYAESQKGRLTKLPPLIVGIESVKEKKIDTVSKNVVGELVVTVKADTSELEKQLKAIKLGIEQMLKSLAEGNVGI